MKKAGVIRKKGSNIHHLAASWRLYHSIVGNQFDQYPRVTHYEQHKSIRILHSLNDLEASPHRKLDKGSAQIPAS